MMSSEMFSSEEVIYFEGSPVEPSHTYHPESYMRSYENVVYVPHILSPVMLLEYIPVYYNYQTYEPYLINRSQVFYVPFVRQVSYTYFVPYYYRYSVPEVFESSTQSEDDTSSNDYQESSLENSLSDELIYEDDLNSSSDETSVLSSSCSCNSYEDSVFSSGEEMCDFSQGFVCDENIDSFDGKRDEDDESNTGWEYPQEVFSAVDEYRVNEADDFSLSLYFGDGEKKFLKSGLKRLEEMKEPSLKNVEKERDLNRISPDRSENRINFDDRNDIESDDSSIPLFVDEEIQDNFIGSENVEESSLKNVEKERDLSRLSPDRYENDINFDDGNDVESIVSSISSLVDEEMQENFIGSENVEESSLKNVEKERDLSGPSPNRCENDINFDDRNDIEPDVSSISSLDHEEMQENFIGLENVEESSLQNVEKERDLSRLSHRCENYINSDGSNDKDSCVSSMSSLDYVTKYQDENDFEHSELSSFKKENVKRSESYSSTQLSVQSQKIMLQKPESLHNFDAIVPELFDDVNSESENDSDGDPAITLQDILASDEYWKVKREAYMQKRRNSDLYRSCLEGDIHPRRSLPQVGTLATIFEDLPFPINEPYDDGLQRVEETETEDHFDLPPLEVQRSNSSSTALLPRKKRFRKTKKFFSGLFRCFMPPP